LNYKIDYKNKNKIMDIEDNAVDYPAATVRSSGTIVAQGTR
jgi:hypothetical protein